MDFFKNIEFILQHNVIFFTIFFFILGACIASFFNVVILRMPEMIEQDSISQIQAWFEEHDIVLPEAVIKLLKPISLSFPGSHCYSCGNALKWYHNIPVLSYIFLRGKCGFCHTRYSVQYPLVELLGGIILGAAFYLFIAKGLVFFLFAGIVFMLCFLLAGIDFKNYLLPDSLNFSLFWIGLIFTTQNITFLPLTVTQSIYGAITGYLILFVISFLGKLIKRQEVMGGGDLKLIPALGILVGFKGAIFTVFFSPFIGIATWIIFKILKPKEVMVPYGPSLIMASIFYIFYGETFLRSLGIIV